VQAQPISPVPPPEEYQWLIDHSPHLISRHDLQGTYLYASPAWAALTGYSQQELLGHSIYDFLLQMDAEGLRCAALGAQSRQSIPPIEYQVRRKDGTYAWVETICKPASNGSAAHEVVAYTRDISELKHISSALDMLSRGMDHVTSDDFFRPFVSHVTFALRANYAFVTEVNPDNTRVKMLAFWKGEDFGAPLEYALQGTPCDAVINQGKTCYYPIGIQALFPSDRDLVALKAQGYFGIPIYNSQHKVIGHLAVLHARPLHISDWQRSVLKLFALRAGMELERLHEERGNA
jgi:PAS domain S-box-containing protein